MSSTTTSRTGGEWLDAWDPENEETWDKRLAWTTLSISTFTLTLCFASWFLASAIAPKLTNLGFDLTQSQLYWLTSMPGLAGGLMRLAAAAAAANGGGECCCEMVQSCFV